MTDVMSSMMSPVSFQDLLTEANVPTQDDVVSLGGKLAGFQAQIDEARANLQRQIDEFKQEVREHIEGHETRQAGAQQHGAGTHRR